MSWQICDDLPARGEEEKGGGSGEEERRETKTQGARTAEPAAWCGGTREVTQL